MSPDFYLVRYYLDGVNHASRWRTREDWQDDSPLAMCTHSEFMDDYVHNESNIVGVIFLTGFFDYWSLRGVKTVDQIRTLFHDELVGKSDAELEKYHEGQWEWLMTITAENQDGDDDVYDNISCVIAMPASVPKAAVDEFDAER